MLASSSRYRRELLARLGLPFAVDSPHIDEIALPGEAPRETALRLAEAKARAVAVRHPGALVIGCDQVAELDGRVIGKPEDPVAALEQLQSMRGRTVVFRTALCLLDAASGRCRCDLVDVASTFRKCTDLELARYLEREQPFDCAGSIKSEGLGIALLERVESDDPTALIGLPLIRLVDFLRAAGVAVI